jgi:hypothetical protein
MITTRNLVLAAATLLTLGTTALSSTEASAFGFRHGGFRHSSFGHYGYRHFGYRHFGYRHWGYRSHWNYRSFAWRSPYRYSYRWPVRNYWRPAVYSAPMIGQSAMSYGAPASAPAMAVTAPAQPACLAKQYTPEGAVVFIDRCTQESAVAGPGGANAPLGGPQAQQQ